MSISSEIKKKRKCLNLTQEELTEKILVSSKTISNWETGKTTPDIYNLIRLKQVSGVSLDELLLEGSELMKSLKINHLIKFRIYSLVSYFALILNLLVLTAKNNKYDLTLQIAIYGSIISALIGICFFTIQINKIYSELSDEEKKNDKKFLVCFVSGLIIISIIAFVFLIK